LLVQKHEEISGLNSIFDTYYFFWCFSLSEVLEQAGDFILRFNFFQEN